LGNSRPPPPNASTSCEEHQATLWQRDYYDHIIRDEGELNEIRQYISDNPAAWETDDNNPIRHVELGMKKDRRPDGH